MLNLLTRPNTKLPVRAAIALFTAGVAGSALAQDTPQPYEMIVIGDAASGWMIEKGKYEEAIEKVTRSQVALDRFSLANNLCVAYTMTKDFDNAEAACNEAVPASLESAKSAKANPIISRSFVRTARIRNGAIAHTNRGVYRVLIGDPDGAREDFEKARELRVKMEAPARNLERLSARTRY